MSELNFLILLIATISFNPTLARPDLLKQQRYEFQEFHTSSSQDQIFSYPENARLEVAPVPVPVQQEPILWSQQHQNEVNAFAEMFRQNYNQMIEQYNKMMQMHNHALTNPFMPVTYELYHVSDEVMWKNYFGNQQKYVHDQTEQMSRQLIQNLEQGLVVPQDLMNPNFFIAQAASELNRVHQVQNEFEINDQQVGSSFGDTYQQHQFDTFNAQQQQQHQIFAESTHHQETEGTAQVLVFNHKTGEYQYVTVVAAPEVPPHEELAGAMVSNANVQHPSYIQRIPPVRINNEMSNKFSQEVKTIEVHTPVSVETPRLAQQNFNEGVNKVSTHKLQETNNDEFYGSTYDQQPIYDLQFVESVSSTARPSMVNVMSLVRNKTKVKISTTTSEPSTTTSTTTELPTTESSIMSLLPNKKPSFNYTDIYHKVRAELDRQMISDNKSEETHFMGMTSNIDHAKLSYNTIQDGKDHKESRGDQPSKTDDYISEEYVESEPGVGYYSVNTEPQLVGPTTSVKPFSTPSPISSTTKPVGYYSVNAEPQLVGPTTSVKTSSTPSPISSTAKPNRGYQNPFYTAPLAPFPTTTIESANPYYSAPLAPFPVDIFQVPQVTVQLQIGHSELSDMSQEAQVIEQPNGSHFAVADTIQEFNKQQYDDFILENSEFQISRDDMQEYENVQQRYFDIGGGHNMEGQRYEKQLPPEQSYQNPDLQHSVAGFDHNNDISAHVKVITETPTPVDNKTQKNWFQRQFSKLKNVF